MTKQEISALKEQHSVVYEIEIEGKKGYFKKPTRKTLMYASSMLNSNPLRFNEILMKECWLGGDECIINDDDYFLAVSGKLGEIIEVKNAELKKI
jgi:hypothetical protein